VDEAKCTGCGECLEKCPSKVPSEFEMGLANRKAIYVPFMQAVPRVMTIDKDNCLMLTKGKCGNCKKACKREAINYEMKDQILEIEVGAIIVATGFDVWNPTTSTEYGYGRYPNVFTAMEYERMINAAGPTHGHIKRRSDGKRPMKMAFIQCVGSRNPTVGHPYCCGVCCMHSTKEAMLAREHYDDIESTIFYKDMRACSKGFFEYVERAKRDYGVRFVNSDATVQENPDTKNPVVVFDVGGRQQSSWRRRWCRGRRPPTWPSCSASRSTSSDSWSPLTGYSGPEARSCPGYIWQGTPPARRTYPRASPRARAPPRGPSRPSCRRGDDHT
jgi:heterodisulfide reductase subunit A